MTRGTTGILSALVAAMVIMGVIMGCSKSTSPMQPAPPAAPQPR
jgi:hypothetical protein